MKRLLGIGLAALLVGLGVWVWQSRREVTPSGARPVTVAATIFPLADIVKNIGGDRVDVVLLIPPGVTEHSLTLTPQTLAQLQQAQAVFAIGQKLDDQLVARVTAARPMPVVTVERGLTLRPFDGSTDPHYWLTVPNAQQIAKTVAAELSKRDPVGSDNYQKNLADYNKRLEDLEKELQTQAAQVKQKYFFATHDGWSYFAERYGLVLAITYEPVEGKEPSLQDLARLRGLVQQHKLTTFYAEPQKATSSATQFLQREFGLRVVTLDPVGGLEPDDSYIKLMRRNLAAMVAGASE